MMGAFPLLALMQTSAAGGEASLVLPDLSSVSFLGLTGRSLLMVGLEGSDKMQAIYEITPGGEPKALTDKFGRLDGLYMMPNGDIIATDWATGSVFQWNKAMGVKKLVDGFKGPADFAAVPNAKGLLLAVPDLVKGEIRFIQLGK